MLARELLQREAGLIKAALPAAKDEDILDALLQFCEEMAVDMADREADSVPIDFMAFTAEYVFNTLGNSDEISSIVNKISSVSLFESSDAGSSRQFPHSEIFNYFLASAIIRGLKDDEIAPILRVRFLQNDLLEAIADSMRACAEGEFKKAQNTLFLTKRRERHSEKLQSNINSILMASLVRGHDIEPIILTKSNIDQARVFDTLSPASINESSIGVLDCRGADLTAISWELATIAVMVADETTRFGDSLPQVGLLHLASGGSLKSVRAPDQIKAWLLQRSLISSSKEDQWDRTRNLPRVKYFDRLCRRFLRQYQIRDNDRDDGANLIRDPYWEDTKKALGTWLSVEKKASRGTNNFFYQLKSPEELLNPEEDSEAYAIRTKIVELALAERDDE